MRATRHFRLLLPAVALVAINGACDAPPEQDQSRPTAADAAAEWADDRRTVVDRADAEPAVVDDEASIPSEERFPCTIATQAEVEELLGNAVEPASYALEQVEAEDQTFEGQTFEDQTSEDQTSEAQTSEAQTFEAQTCSWLTFADGASEVTVQVSRPQHFAGEEVVCHGPQLPQPEGTMDEEEPAAGPEPDLEPDFELAESELVEEPALVEIDGLGYGAWWRYDDVIGLGNLLVCDQRARVAIEVSVGDPALDARGAAVELARRALAGVVGG